MTILEAIHARRTVQNYQHSEISKEHLQEALEAALTAPNHKYTFPWQFVVVGRETRARLVDIAVELKLSKHNDPTEETKAKVRGKVCQKLLNPAALVVFLSEVCEDEFRRREDYASVACAIQNFSLALVHQGYGSKWGTGGLTRDPRSYEILGVDAARLEICGFVWVGHSATEFSEQRRPALTDVLRELP